MTTLRVYALQDSGQCVCCQRRNGDNIQRLVRGDVNTADERFTYACPKVRAVPTWCSVLSVHAMLNSPGSLLAVCSLCVGQAALPPAPACAIVRPARE